MFDTNDFVMLSGSQTLGTSRSVYFIDRSCNFTEANNPTNMDPTMNIMYMAKTRSKCWSFVDNTTLTKIDLDWFLSFDYSLIAKR